MKTNKEKYEELFRKSHELWRQQKPIEEIVAYNDDLDLLWETLTEEDKNYFEKLSEKLISEVLGPSLQAQERAKKNER